MNEQQRAVVQQALEALEVVWREHKAIDGLRQLLEQPVQEPVAWMQSDEVHIALWADDCHTIPLYTTPPPPAAPVPLTDGVNVPRAVLEAAEESLGSFCSDRGWSDKDVRNMDKLSALIARHKNHALTKGQP